MCLKKVVLLVGFLYISFSACTTQKAALVQNHSYYNMLFYPKQVQQQMALGKVDVIVTPVDAKSLNEETFEAAMRDGNYEKEFLIEVEKRKKELDKEHSSSFIKGITNAIDALNKLERDNAIPKDVAFNLKKRILYGNEFGRTGDDIKSFLEEERYPDEYNPFKVNNKYLSVFKIVFSNKHNEIETIRLKEFQVVSGEELLYPLSASYFEDNLKPEQEKIKNAYRMNMPEELVLTPGQKITKYIAVPAINSKNENLRIQIINAGNVSNFDFKVVEQTITKTYSFENYNFVSLGIPSTDSHYGFYAVAFQNGPSFALKDPQVLVDEEKRNVPASIYAICIHKNNSRIRVAKKVDFKFAEQVDKKVSIQFEAFK